MSPGIYNYENLNAHFWKAKQLSQVFFFLSDSVTPFTDKRPDLIIKNSITDEIQFEKFELLEKGAACYLLMMGKSFKVRSLDPLAAHGRFQLEDETGAIIEFEAIDEM